MDRLIVPDQESGEGRQARDGQDIAGPDVDRVTPDLPGVFQEIAGNGPE
ncbi:MAG: hypothetical protein WCC00_13300 [Candidatus Aminicenantales bacterium]